MSIENKKIIINCDARNNCPYLRARHYMYYVLQ